jgi:multicomponent K+:H+ antiporter subunit G
MTGETAVLVEAAVAALIVFSGVFVLISAVGFLRFQDFFVRMHPPALAYTLGTWLITAAAILDFSMLEGRLALHPLLIAVLLAITVPVTTLMRARAVLFRRRAVGDPDTPPALTPPQAS